VKNQSLYVELDVIKPEEQIAQWKTEDNSNHLDISLVNEQTDAQI